MDAIDPRTSVLLKDLRAIQRELNCAVMRASADPKLRESLSAFDEIGSIEVLRSALGEMLHFFVVLHPNRQFWTGSSPLPIWPCCSTSVTGKHVNPISRWPLGRLIRGHQPASPSMRTGP